MTTASKLLLSVLGLCALPAVQAAEFEDYGRVTRVQPRVEQVRQPREECRTEYIQAPVQQQQRSAGGGIIGAIAGGIIGNQVGGGSGRAAATAVGAITGAVVGDRIDNNGRQGNQQGYAQEQAVRQCRIVESWEPRTMGYDVTYDYRGRSYTSMMDRDPGDRVRLRISIQPDPIQ